jgi:hypothetical protein
MDGATQKLTEASKLHGTSDPLYLVSAYRWETCQIFSVPSLPKGLRVTAEFPASATMSSGDVVTSSARLPSNLEHGRYTSHYHA